MPVSSLNTRAHTQMLDDVEIFNSLSSDTHGSSLDSKITVGGEVSSTNDDMPDNVVWKQMGTAKGTGRLFKGGKWLRNVKVHVIWIIIIFILYLL